MNKRELHELYSLTNIIGLIRARRGWAGNVACMEEIINVYRVCVGET